MQQVSRNLRIPDSLLTRAERAASRVGLTIQDYVVGLINGKVRQPFAVMTTKPAKKGSLRMVNFHIDEDTYERFLDRCPVQRHRPMAGPGLTRLLQEAV